MPISKLFWFLGALTVVFLALQVSGYFVTEIIIALLIINLIVLKVSQESTSHKYAHKTLENINDRLGGIHSVLVDLTNFTRGPKTNNPGPATHSHGKEIVTLGAIENALNKHKGELRVEFKGHLDKIATKAIDIENSLHEVRSGFSSAIAAFDDRMRTLEGNIINQPNESVLEEEPEYVEIN